MHASSVSPTFWQLVCMIGIVEIVDFGSFVISQLLHYVDSYALKLPIGFPCLLYAIMMSQHPTILSVGEQAPSSSLKMHYISTTYCFKGIMSLTSLITLDLLVLMTCLFRLIFVSLMVGYFIPPLFGNRIFRILSNEF